MQNYGFPGRSNNCQDDQILRSSSAHLAEFPKNLLEEHTHSLLQQNAPSSSCESDASSTMGAVAGKERTTDTPTRLRVWTTSCEEGLEEIFLVLKTWASLEHTLTSLWALAEKVQNSPILTEKGNCLLQNHKG